jgi:hypothetical protein
MIKAAGETEQRPLTPYGALRTALAKESLTVGDVLSLAKEYLPSESQDALMKAEAPIGDFLEQLRTLAKEAGTGTEVEAPAERRCRRAHGRRHDGGLRSRAGVRPGRSLFGTSAGRGRREHRIRSAGGWR